MAQAGHSYEDSGLCLMVPQLPKPRIENIRLEHLDHLLTIAHTAPRCQLWLTEGPRIWDSVAKHKDAYVAAAGTGASLGIAYHLAMDATVQQGTYHGMPAPMPQEAHNAIMGANSATEAIDTAMRKGERVTLACAHCSSKVRAPAGIRRMVRCPECKRDFWADTH